MFEVDPSELVAKVAVELGKVPEVKAPDWASFVKTSRSKERPPQRSDWWQVRSAAVLRSVAKLGPIGVSKLRTKYGSKKNRGHKPEHFYKGSGNIARKILQQLEKAGFLRQAQKGNHKGRVITKKAAELLNKAALELGATKTTKVVKEKKPEVKEAKEGKEEKTS